jgi:tRNA-2-methylthio-N6-dimethylallyladenosine synthase
LEGLMAKQKEIQITRYKKYIGDILEVMVEGKNEARQQWTGRTSHNKTLNFTAPAEFTLEAGTYVKVKATRSFPNSLLGELVI